ncbi:MAG: hypothetical protein QOE88_533 [Verrucomicrobiota bacterium]|jgi:hypothetical protein|nr:hypothetical protein [Verrucomicrobiota bacterium]MEA3162715.1 hypothetical protein [Verrucomicrobiota bacterium]
MFEREARAILPNRLFALVLSDRAHNYSRKLLRATKIRRYTMEFRLESLI